MKGCNFGCMLSFGELISSKVTLGSLFFVGIDRKGPDEVIVKLQPFYHWVSPDDNFFLPFSPPPGEPLPVKILPAKSKRGPRARSPSARFEEN